MQNEIRRSAFTRRHAVWPPPQPSPGVPREGEIPMTRRGNNILLHLVLLLIAGMTLVPFAFVINNSLRTNTEQNHSFFGMPKSVYLDGYRFAWQTLRPYVVNSLLVCAGTVAGVVLVASISGYVFARYRFPGHRLLFLAILSFMMIPGILTLV